LTVIVRPVSSETDTVKRIEPAASGALVSPIDSLSAELSWVHMVQHMILMMVAAPLLVLGHPGFVALWALPLSWRQKIGGWGRDFDNRYPDWYALWQPLATWSLYAIGLWIWHIPWLYQSGLQNRWTHDLQHLTFLITSWLFWRVLLDPSSRVRLSRGLGVIYLFTTSLHATALGVFMALSPRVWYPAYEATTSVWNLSALEDQQLAGLIMWMPACMVYAVAAAALFALWLEEPEQRGGVKSSQAVKQTSHSSTGSAPAEWRGSS
jgi:putative membrane protein